MIKVGLIYILMFHAIQLKSAKLMHCVTYKKLTMSKRKAVISRPSDRAITAVLFDTGFTYTFKYIYIYI